MADLSRVRKRILSAIIALAAVDVGALIYLALPLREGAAEPTQVQAQAQEEYRTLSRTALPLRGIDDKLQRAQKDDSRFIEVRLPSRYSDVLEELGKLAVANHISITNVTYKTDPASLSGITGLEMHAGLAGPYLNLVKFTNGVERDKVFFIIDSIGLTGQNGGEVRLDMKLETYLRNQR
jgi:type IV pilus assembly protein PilO